MIILDMDELPARMMHASERGVHRGVASEVVIGQGRPEDRALVCGKRPRGSTGANV